MPKKILAKSPRLRLAVGFFIKIHLRKKADRMYCGALTKLDFLITEDVVKATCRQCKLRSQGHRYPENPQCKTSEPKSDR